MDTTYSAKRERQEKSADRLELLVEGFKDTEISPETLRAINMSQKVYRHCATKRSVL